LLSSKIKRSVTAISARIALQQKIIQGSKTGSLLTDQYSSLYGQVLPTLRARQFEPGSNRLPEMIR
jgi:hypothetical protein